MIPRFLLSSVLLVFASAALHSHQDRDHHHHDELARAKAFPAQEKATPSQQTTTPQKETHLKPLEFLIGDWVAEGEFPGVGHFTAARTYRWILDKNFIEQTHKMKFAGMEFEVTGILGWDQQKQKIIAWGFGNDGGIAQSESDPAVTDLVFEGMRVSGVSTTPIRATFKKLSYDDFTEFAEMKKDAAWTPIFTFHFTRKRPQR